LNSKEHLKGDAENLYVYEMVSITDIADRLNLSLRTLCRWKEKFDWVNKRKNFIKSKESFHHELYDFARNLMKDITEDIKSGNKIDQGRMYTFCKLIPLFTKVKDYEDNVNKKEKPDTQKGLTAETIAKIEREVLGITHDDCETE